MSFSSDTYMFQIKNAMNKHYPSKQICTCANAGLAVLFSLALGAFSNDYDVTTSREIEYELKKIFLGYSGAQSESFSSHAKCPSLNIPFVEFVETTAKNIALGSHKSNAVFVVASVVMGLEDALATETERLRWLDVLGYIMGEPIMSVADDLDPWLIRRLTDALIPLAEGGNQKMRVAAIEYLGHCVDARITRLVNDVLATEESYEISRAALRASVSNYNPLTLQILERMSKDAERPIAISAFRTIVRRSWNDDDARMVVKRIVDEYPPYAEILEEQSKLRNLSEKSMNLMLEEIKDTEWYHGQPETIDETRQD